MQEAVRAAYEAVAGRPLEQAPRLSIRPPPAASINRNDATIDADAALPSATTARPVITPSRSSGGWRVGVLLAAGVAAAAGAYAFSHGAAEKTERADRPAGAPATKSAATGAALRQESTSAIGAHDDSRAPPMPPAASAKVERGEKRSVTSPAASVRKAQRTPAAAPSAPDKAPPAPDTAKPQESSVDLFSRRK